MRICMGHWTGSVEYTSTDGTHVFVWWMASATSASHPLQTYTCNPVHHIESHVIDTYSKGLPAEVANHLTNTASIVPAIAHIPCSTSLHHFHFFDVIGSMRAPNHGGRWGRTNNWYACVLTAWEEIFRFLRRSTRMLLAFAVTLLMRVLNLRSEVRVRPRYLTESVLWRGWSCSLYDLFIIVLLLPVLMVKHFVCIELHKPSLFPRADRIKV